MLASALSGGVYWGWHQRTSLRGWPSDLTLNDIREQLCRGPGREGQEMRLELVVVVGIIKRCENGPNKSSHTYSVPYRWARSKCTRSMYLSTNRPGPQRVSSTLRPESPVILLTLYLGL